MTVVSCKMNGLFSLGDSFGTMNTSDVIAGSLGVVSGTSEVLLPNIKTFNSTTKGLHRDKLSRIVGTRIGGNGPLLNVYLNVRVLLRHDCRCNVRRNLKLVRNRVQPVDRAVRRNLGVPRVN